MIFRRARRDDRQVLDEMTLAGVRHWGHDQNHPEVYQGLVDLVASQDEPDTQLIFVLEDDSEILGFYELRDGSDHVELLRMFVRPDLIGKGYGRTLWNHAVEQAAQLRSRMLIMSDPSSNGFYSAMGAELQENQEVAPGFSLGVYWFNLTS